MRLYAALGRVAEHLVDAVEHQLLCVGERDERLIMILVALVQVDLARAIRMLVALLARWRLRRERLDVGGKITDS